MSYPVDRTMLRNVLLLGQENNIKFNKSFTYYETSSTSVTAFFSDGTSEQGTLLVGADGTVSPVRRQLLPDVRYVDTGSRVIYGKTPLTDELVARLPASIMKGMSIVQDSSPLTLFLETVKFPNDAGAESNGRVPRIDDYVYWVLGGSAETVGLSDTEFHGLSGQGAADLTLKLTAHWDPSFKAIFELQNSAQSAPLRLISAKRERPEWTPSANVILMGDAIQ
jgi:2-polyprenyl-6-methoxyphenol hydroxylase-like FAD-dependent oxidoreductase